MTELEVALVLQDLMLGVLMEMQAAGPGLKRGKMENMMLGMMLEVLGE